MNNSALVKENEKLVEALGKVVCLAQNAGVPAMGEFKDIIDEYYAARGI